MFIPAAGGCVISVLLWGYANRRFFRQLQFIQKVAPSLIRRPISQAITVTVILCLCLSGLAWTAPALLTFPSSAQSFFWPWIEQILLSGLCAFSLSVVLRTIWTPAKDWMGKLPLFLSIALWVAFAATLLTLLVTWWGGWPTNVVATSRTGSSTSSFEAIKVALTAVAGIGGVAYLVIRYKTEQRETASIADTKVQAAVNQLGSDSASTRIAGVYALTDIADTYKGRYRQRVVNILCGYLRSDRETYVLDKFGQPIKDESGHLIKSENSDEAVETTIRDMFLVHLRKERRDKKSRIVIRQQVKSDQLWCNCGFDLHGAIFHGNVSFIGLTFNKRASFRNATFNGRAKFDKTYFNGFTNFQNTEFKDSADFNYAIFRSNRTCFNATVDREASLVGAQFHGGVTFQGLHLSSNASITFKNAQFNRKYQGTDVYQWGSAPIPKNNEGLPEGAMWVDFPEE